MISIYLNVFFFFAFFFQGETRIDVRKYLPSEFNPTDVYPTKTGISLKRQQWNKFKSIVFRENVCGLKSILCDFQEEIDNNIYLTHSSQYNSVGIRKWYFNDGKLCAGKPGINFSLKQWTEFVHIFAKIDKELMKIEQCDCDC